jgi:hypothetical protein
MHTRLGPPSVALEPLFTMLGVLREQRIIRDPSIVAEVPIVSLFDSTAQHTAWAIVSRLCGSGLAGAGGVSRRGREQQGDRLQGGVPGRPRRRGCGGIKRHKARGRQGIQRAPRRFIRVWWLSVIDSVAPPAPRHACPPSMPLLSAGITPAARLPISMSVCQKPPGCVAPLSWPSTSPSGWP